jgi:hypothetical protein
MKRLAILFVLSLVSTSAFAYEDSFSYYYGSSSPMVNCNDGYASASGGGSPPKTVVEHDKEVEYLYGRNVLGYDEATPDAPMITADGEMPYGWSLRAPLAGN